MKIQVNGRRQFLLRGTLLLTFLCHNEAFGPSREIYQRARFANIEEKARGGIPEGRFPKSQPTPRLFATISDQDEKKAEVAAGKKQKATLGVAFVESMEEQLEELARLTASSVDFVQDLVHSASVLDTKQAVSGETVVLPAENNDVFVGNPTMMRKDKALRLMSSEVSVWKNFRKGMPPFIPLHLVVERAWDSMEDILVHLRRVRYDKGWAELSREEERTRKTVVVLGSGWAAHALMKVADCNKLRLIVVSPSNHFVFTPMLASAAVGTIEYRSMTEAVRVANPMIHEFLEGSATDVDLKQKTVTVKMHSLTDEVQAPTMTLKYDHLVVAVGAVVNDYGVPGAHRALRLKSVDDARRIRTTIAECFEYASRPEVAGDENFEERSRRVTFLIVGGGPTGVELAGELHDFFKDVTRSKDGSYRKLADAVRVVVAEGGPELVPPFEPGLRRAALKALEKEGIEVILNCTVTEIGEKYAKLKTAELDPVTGEKTGNFVETTLPVGVTVWCAGAKPVPFVEKLLDKLSPEARFRGGRVKVDRWMRPITDEKTELGSLFVLGDAAAYDDDGTILPTTAQVAGQQGAFMARLLDRNYDLTTTPPKLRDLEEDQIVNAEETTNTTELGVFYDPAMNRWLRFRGLETSPPFGFLNLGLMASLGGGEALTQVQLGKVRLLALFGSPAFVLCKSVYLAKQVATRNRVLLMFDWFKSAVFGRDVTRL